MFANSPLSGSKALANAVKSLYEKGQTDYYLEPLIRVDNNNLPLGQIKDGDAVIFCCRRGEREIELTESFTDPNFSHFTRPDLKNLTFVILTLYHEKFKDLPIAFAPVKINDTLAEIVSRAGLKQLHVSESEKFAHVTFFLNGGNNQPFDGEDDICLPSPKGIPFDQVPELKLSQVADQVIEGIENKIDFIVTNFANGDVIGHTANNDAKIKCAAFVDKSLEKVVDSARKAGYVTFITADHGNLEVMINPDGTPNVGHTTNKVPFVVVDNDNSITEIKNGKLADLAPTVLSALSLEQPDIMTGTTLTPGSNWGGKRRVLLIILDGWGLGENNDTNPIYAARTPTWDQMIRKYPNSALQAAGEAVGLKSGKAGNSEAGHLNIGAGRVVLQDDVRLDQALTDGYFYLNEVFLQTISDVKTRGTNLHLIGLLTEKSSHGSIDYPLALLKMAKASGLEDAYLHIIFDGRSTEPGSAPLLLEKLEKQIKEIGIGQVVSGIGRGIALDRDGNFDKIKVAYDSLVNGIGNFYSQD